MSPVASVAPESADREAAAGRAATAFAWLWIAGTVFAGLALTLLATLPPLPTDPDSVSGWVGDGAFPLTWAGELLFFAIIAWGAGAAGVVGAHAAGAPVRRALSSAALGVVLVGFAIILLALGRLVYPVADIDLTAGSIVLLASVVSGTVHLSLLALAVVAVSLPVGMRSLRARRATVAAGIAFGVLFAVGSFPWLLPTWSNVVVAGAVAGWGVFAGLSALARDRRAARSRGSSRRGTR
ncbi:hypothetical protein [Herbiconiux daphne]|uniref:DUF998 domain-containing protein n=1 Tax=Herbiconiux daphne TaxID=2970914 RepID=A0ABT2H2A0_9MICO|nr:hypothetical protein [Herbiconiux daphne]MCS5734083.1 hypothetical protein [Herbiconiux daphne]